MQPAYRLDHLFSIATLIFYGTNLWGSSGYTAGFVLALCAAFYVLFTARPQLPAESRTLVFWCLLMPVAGLWAFLYNEDIPRVLDLPLKYLAAIVLIWAGTRSAPNPKAWWAAVGAGALSGAGIAWYELYIVGLERAQGDAGAIRFGNIGLTLGVFCAAGLVWVYRHFAGSHKKFGACLFLAAGTLGGLYASLASGSRGGWITLPLVITLFVIARVKQVHPVKTLATIATGCIVATALLFSFPETQKRFSYVASDIASYQEGNYNTSIGLRLAIWNATLTLIMEKPLTGWGESGYYSALDQGATSGRFAKEVVTVAHSHNDYLETWVKYGLLGLVSMLGLYASSFILFCRRLRHPNPSIQALALCGSCLAGIFAISGFSQLMLGRNNTLLFFLVSIALLWGMLQRQIKTHDNSIQA